MEKYALGILRNIKLNKLYKECMAFWGFERQARMLQEECAELIVALSHYMRDRIKNKDVSPRHVVEELADVQLMVNQLTTYFGEEKINEVMNIKAGQVKEELNKYKNSESGETNG